MGYQLRTRWLEGFEHDDDARAQDVRKTLDECIAMLRDIQAKLDALERLEPGDVSTPQAPEAA